MNEPQYANPQLLRNTMLQLNFEALSAEMVRMRCEVILQQNIWFRQQQRLVQHNQLLLLTLMQTVSQNANTQTKLQQVSLESQYDVLTKTLNRSVMLDRISQAISLSKRQQSRFALLFIDLDQFKPVNDQYGHAAGDAVLLQVSARLTAAVRDSDAVSRHGGDEFLLLLNDIKDSQAATLFANRLVQALAQPYQIAGASVSLSASIGIALYPEHSHSANTLINYADAAMYRAKQQGGGRVC
ncbi:diguanylate cyclase (GGDEF)-like protein [Rheinheimera pacifica]|uniref:GGDEF domain-containing protein n=1 Tax=Rheinheimera pacifica TaxID=173990 RepID=UPI0028612833|nr:GGDEF domain-containing protein [Rheinheimera pacifica]MDR6984798.1 diguanylate cyclase (GGDEF)-like protein [Rheinheimera pacifica]